MDAIGSLTALKLVLSLARLVGDEEDKCSLLGGNGLQKCTFRMASALLGRGPGLAGGGLIQWQWGDRRKSQEDNHKEDDGSGGGVVVAIGGGWTGGVG